MKFTKKALLVSVMSISLIAPMSGCSSTTEAGAVGADRKQLLLVSSEGSFGTVKPSLPADHQRSSQGR